MKHIVALQSTVAKLPPFAEQFVQQILLNLKMHDVDTFQHCLRVGEKCRQIAEAMSLSPEQIAICMYAGLLHDVGKSKVPVYIINKPAKLSMFEYDEMKKHAEYGVEILAPLVVLPFFVEVSEAIMYHHERMDGQGYHGLTPDKIPLISKIILVCDTVDAMTQDRPYREGCTIERAHDELVQCSGTQFDPKIVEVYLNLATKKQTTAA